MSDAVPIEKFYILHSSLTVKILQAAAKKDHIDLHAASCGFYKYCKITEDTIHSKILRTDLRS
jgi:hypothetical protein